MMKSNPISFAGCLFAAFLLVSSAAFASDISHEGHGGHGSHGSPPAAGGHSDHNQTDHSQHEGKNIRNVETNGYKLAYHLIDMKQKMAAMKDAPKMPEMKSHHLMIYITTADGKMITDAQTGFLVVGPDGDNQKAMAMAMGGGYGADLNFKRATYTIKTKIMIAGNKHMDEFTFKMP